MTANLSVAWSKTASIIDFFAWASFPHLSAASRCYMTLDQMRYWPSLAYGYSRLVAATAPRAIIHTNWHHALLLLPFLSPHRDIFWIHECYPQTSRYGRMLRAIAKKVGRVVCVSRAVARSVLALGVPESQVVVIHNGLPLHDSIAAPGERPPLRLGIVGQIGPWKGHEDLLEALALLAARWDSSYIASLRCGRRSSCHVGETESVRSQSGRYGRMARLCFRSQRDLC